MMMNQRSVPSRCTFELLENRRLLSAGDPDATFGIGGQVEHDNPSLGLSFLPSWIARSLSCRTRSSGRSSVVFIEPFYQLTRLLTKSRGGGRNETPRCPANSSKFCNPPEPVQHDPRNNWRCDSASETHFQ